MTAPDPREALIRDLLLEEAALQLRRLRGTRHPKGMREQFELIQHIAESIERLSFQVSADQGADAVRLVQMTRASLAEVGRVAGQTAAAIAKSMEPPAEKLAPFTFNTRELATVLAALRYWQAAEGAPTDPAILDIVTNGDTLIPLRVAEIDKLCERLNS